MASPATARLRRAALTLMGAAFVAAVIAPSTVYAAPAAPSPQDLQAQLDARARQLAVVVEQYDGLKLQLDKTTAQAQAAAAALGPMQDRVAAADAAVAALATQAYEGGTIAGFSALINAGSPQGFVDRLTTLDSLARERHARITEDKLAAAEAVAQKMRLDQLVAQQRQQQATLTVQAKRIQSEIDALQRERNQLLASLPKPAPAPAPAPKPVSKPAPPPPVNATGRTAIVVRYAYAQLGKPYQWAAAGPNSFDCSGLTMAAWAQVGVHLDHFTGAQINEGTPVSRSQLQPADLVFFYGGSHVGLYIGNNKVIHAPQPGDVVKISDIDTMSYYAARRPH